MDIQPYNEHTIKHNRTLQSYRQWERGQHDQGNLPGGVHPEDHTHHKGEQRLDLLGQRLGSGSLHEPRVLAQAGGQTADTVLRPVKVGYLSPQEGLKHL